VRDESERNFAMSTNSSASGWDGTTEYAADPEAETHMVVDAFFGHLAATLRLSDDVVAAMRLRLDALLAANASRIVDEPARHNLRMTLAVLSGYEAISPELGPERAFAAVSAAFTEPLAAAVSTATKAMLDHAADPFRAMVELARSRESEAFGAGFAFEHPADDDTRFFADVHRCHYHDVLVANGAPQLTPVLCAFDANWFDAIDPDRHGFTFERTTTIGHGGPHCPFHFTRNRPAPSAADE
jgi:hypothetical protein